MASYRILNKQVYWKEDFRIAPLRFEDRHDIMRWRNEQIYHLRQDKLLTLEDQDNYFKKVVNKLFESDKPDQVLFSFFKNEEFVGYGGLVHINWRDKNAEISFIMNTALEKEYFEDFWTKFLSLIEEVAFRQLHLFKIYTYAYNLRPRLYNALNSAGFAHEATLQNHVLFENNYIDVLIHSKINNGIEIREAHFQDLILTYNWVNDKRIRKYSFNSGEVALKDHAYWFFNTLENPFKEYYLMQVNGVSAGSIRFDFENDKLAKISYLLDSNFTGKGLGIILLKKGIEFLKLKRPDVEKVYGWVLIQNIPSVKIFEKLNFLKTSENESEFKFEKALK